MEVIYVTTSLGEANIIKSLLKSYGIPCFLKSEAVRIIYGITINGLGKIEIMVNNEDIALAKEILESQTTD